VNELAEQLLERDYEVTGVDYTENRWSDRVDQNTVYADLRKYSATNDLPDDADLIVHLAANARVHKLIKNPNLAALANSGTKGTLQSTIPCTTVPAVPALTTGKNPANLGLFNFTHPDGSIIDSSDIEPPAIWDAIEPDKRSLIANLRSTYPPYNINGTMIAGDLFLPSGVNDYVTPISRCDELYSFHDDERQSRWNRLARSPDDNADELLNLAREMVRDKYRHFERLWSFLDW
jgi:predicted AlkP superfamily phosphohydrolase/phosphomutase